MACSQTLNGIARDCISSMGGIKRVLLANKDDVSAVTLTDGLISAITMAGGAKFKEYQFRRYTGSLTSTYQVSEDTGSHYVQSDLIMVFNRLETAKRIEITALAQADTVGIVEDMNGKFWFLGYDESLFLADGDAQTGTARNDRNGYQLTLRDNSLELPYEVAASVVSGLV